MLCALKIRERESESSSCRSCLLLVEGGIDYN